MHLSIDAATDLAFRALSRHGMPEHCARLTAEHLVDAALCGHEFSSLARVPAIVEELRGKGPPGEIRIVHETGCSAVIDGGDNVAYAVSIAAIDKAVELARRSGMAIVGARNTWFSGRLAYYVERAARQGFVAMHTTNTTARVAPFGGIDRLMGTNPFALAFPGGDDPLVFDIGTSAITWGDVVLARTKGEAIPEGVAVDAAGRVTTDPQAALDGAFLAWGGARGSALALAVQMLGVWAGSQVAIGDTGNYGLFFMVADPGLLMPVDELKQRVAEFRRTVESNRPQSAGSPVRVPGDGSLRNRRLNRARGTIPVADKVHARILELLA